MTRFRIPLILCLALCGGGCGGHYTLTAGDALGPVGGQTPVVVRLQRNDFFVLDLAVKEALMRFRVAGEPERAAYTDKLGYAGTTVEAPSEPGRHPLRIEHQDVEGQEVQQETSLYAWDPSRAAVAVDADCLPKAGSDAELTAGSAIRKVAESAYVVYLTREPAGDHRRMHERMEAAGYPDGPILLWQRERWHIVRDGPLGMPRVIVESRLVSQLPDLREMFPNIRAGLCRTKLAAKAFASVGVQPVVIGADVGETMEAVHRDSWQDLAERGI